MAIEHMHCACARLPQSSKASALFSTGRQNFQKRGKTCPIGNIPNLGQSLIRLMQRKYESAELCGVRQVQDPGLYDSGGAPGQCCRGLDDVDEGSSVPDL